MIVLIVIVISLLKNYIFKNVNCIDIEDIKYCKHSRQTEFFKQFFAFDQITK